MSSTPEAPKQKRKENFQQQKQQKQQKAPKQPQAAKQQKQQKAPKQPQAAKQAKAKKPDSPYKSSVILPQTEFGQRANAVVREPELQQYWADNRIYEELAESNPGPVYVLHDGPPYANGDLHIGHALNKILKVHHSYILLHCL
jgi:tRNA synthetases class I (I, L, M and V)